jgi:hypothetical protein
MRFVAVCRYAGHSAGGAGGAIILGAAACALTLAACGSVPAAQSAPPASSTPAPSSSAPSSTPAADTPGASAAGAACTTAQLKIAITHTGALAGQAGGYLRFTNDSATTCQMDGWPVVVAQTAAGAVTALRHARSIMYGAWQAPSPLPVLRLRPGDSAYVVVAADDQPAGSASGCPAPFVRLRVSAPGSSASEGVSAWLPGAGTYLPSCLAANGSPSGEVSAITPLSSLPH